MDKKKKKKKRCYMFFFLIINAASREINPINISIPVGANEGTCADFFGSADNEVGQFPNVK